MRYSYVTTIEPGDDVRRALKAARSQAEKHAAMVAAQEHEAGRRDDPKLDFTAARAQSDKAHAALELLVAAVAVEDRELRLTVSGVTLDHDEEDPDTGAPPQIVVRVEHG